MGVDISDVTFIDEEDLAPLIDLEIRIDELKIQTVQKQAELRKQTVKLRRKLGLKMSDRIDLSQGIAIPIEKAIEAAPEQNGVVA
tara:strand:+ start:186 stop:440 length:255 start_codon:yes stop_codon:yes gene_type:complete